MASKSLSVSVQSGKGAHAHTYTSNSKLSVVSAVNGYMGTPKTYDLWKLIDWLNTTSAGAVIITSSV